MGNEAAVKLKIGDRIYNHGDIANQEHFGTITAEKKGDFGHDYQITPDDDAEREPYWICANGIQDVFKGHGGTRFVTEAAYDAWKAGGK